MVTTEQVEGISNGIKTFLKNNPDVYHQVMSMPNDTDEEIWNRVGVIFKAMDASHWLGNQGVGHYTFAHLATESLADVKSHYENEESEGE